MNQLKSTENDAKDLPGLASRQIAVTVLTRVLDDGRSLDGLLDPIHGLPELSDLSLGDRSLVRAIAVSALRHRGEIELVLGRALSRPPPKRARHLIHTLHCAIAQILFLDIPDSAAVNLAVTAIKKDKRSVRFAALANAVLRRISREKDDLVEKTPDLKKLQANVPRWIWNRLRQDYGKVRATDILLAHLAEPVIDITVKTDPVLWAERLGGFPLVGNSIRVPKKGAIQTWPGYETGDWWVQDVAATLPVHLMGNIRGKNVLDLCAAPGGKTAQLVAAGAIVTAVEQSKPRAQRLKGNLERLGMNASLVTTDLFEWEPSILFDAVLLDAPCSSTGTIRRHPDVQWTKTEQSVTELASLQKQMIEHAAQFVAPGGQLLFSNCSLLREEGEHIIASLNTSSDQLKIEPITAEELFGLDDCITGQGTVRTLPIHLPVADLDVPGTLIEEGGDPHKLGGMDGFFAARFVKTDVSDLPASSHGDKLI